MIENKLFAGGGLNQDVDENFLKPNEWDYALNIRNTDRQEFSDGVISNIKGNTLVTFSLPTGTNKCIGNYANEQTGLYYSFIWNSDGFHTITEYNPSTNIITKVLQSKTDTDGVDILKFQQYELINGVGIIDGHLLYWTDGYNQPRGIDITRAKTGTYYKDEASICLIKQPPQSLIQADYGNDPVTSTASNRLKGQLFQFRYLYVYEDNSRSAWSSISTLPLPSFESISSTDTASYKNNNIVLQFNAGTKYVKSIEIAAKVNGVSTSGTTLDWFSILTVDRSYITGAGASQYAYNSGTNIATYKFYNDGLYQSIDVRETDLQYDYVPLKSKTLDIVNGNVLVLGNNTEGYNNLSDESIALDVDLSVDYVFVETNQLQFLSGTESMGSYSGTFSGIPAGDGTSTTPPSDRILANWSADEGSTYSYSYYVKAEYSGSLYNTLVDFAQSFATNSQSQNLYSYYVYSSITPNGTGGYTINFTKVGTPYDLALSVNNTTSVNTSTAAYKSNSKYQFGIVYYDEFNRSTYVQTNEIASSGNNGGCIVQTKSWGAATGYTPVIDWEIHHDAPDWATQYQWVRTEQLTHKKFLFWSASSVTANPLNPNLYDLNINTLNTFNEANPNSILSYDYSPGDRCTVQQSGSTWISGYDVDVVGYDTSTGVLTIQKKDALTAPVMVEIYTPKTRSNSSTDQFFYEFGEVYSCSGGVHSVTSGTFTDGDVYNKTRTISTSPLYSIKCQDPNFSDYYVSNYSSNGRTNIYAPQAKQLNLPTDIRYSDTYVPNTNINGLNRFYGDAFETYDRVNGSIQKLAVRDNYLMTFQELKTGYIPILQSIIEDQGVGNAANVAISNKLLNKIRYFAGDYGIGKHPESFARFAGTMYFADPNRNVVIKLTNGLQPISMIGMDSYFTTKISYTNTVANSKIIGSYDPRNDEYIVSFTYPSGTNQETVAYNELSDRWTSFYSFIPDNGGYIFNQYITYKNGAMYTHNTNATYNQFYGVNYTSIVQIVYNASPALIKSFIGIMQQSNTVWYLPYIYTSLLQESSLNPADFSKKEGVWFASFLRDGLSPGGLINGDDLKGNWIKLRLENVSATKTALLSVDVRHIPSYQGIK